MHSQFKRILIFIIIVFAFGVSFKGYSAEEKVSLNKFNAAKTWKHKRELATELLTRKGLLPSQRIEIYNQLALTALGQDDFDKALKNFQLVEKNAPREQFPSQHFRSIKMQGVCYYYQGLLQQAVVEYNRALNYAKLDKNQLQQANLLSNIGLAYFDMYNMELSLDYYEQARAIFDIKGSAQDKADILHNIAGVYIRLSRYDSALAMYRQVLEAFQELGDEDGIAQSYGNMGVAYSESKQYQLSLHYYQLALRYYETQNDAFQLANLNTNLANIYQILNEFDLAQFHAKAGETYAKQIDNKPQLAAVLQVLAKVQLARGNLQDANINIDRSVKLANEANDEMRVQDGLGVEALVNASLGNLKKALNLHQEYIDYQRNSNSEQVLKALSIFQSQYEANKLNQEIKELKQARHLQHLQNTKRTQLILMLTLVLLLALITAVAIYRRLMEKKAKAQLAEKVEQRTLELQNVAEELRQANQVKSQFLANISHEIRTPLTAILGQTDLLIQGLYRPENLRNELKVIEKNSDHLKGLINDVLDLSKIEAERLELYMSHFKLVNLLSDLTAMFKPQATSKNLRFIIDNQVRSDYWLKLDYIRVKQVLINLSANAIKFTKTGSVTVRVELLKQGLQFSVIDTGIGMDNEQAKLIFECFRQADNTITRRFGGTGLGLSLSQQLAMMMGGYISVESKTGKGSSFSFYLPCKEYIPTEKELLEVENKQTQERLIGKVLLAEDHPDNRQLITRYLTSLGLDVITAENGEQAVELCLKEFPDVVLLDIQMPIMDGVSALKLLIQAGFDRPVYALTANAMSHAVQAYLDAGFFGYLSKPLDQNACYQSLLAHCATVESTISEGVDMSDLIHSFTQSFNKEVEQIKIHWADNDLAALKQASHRLLGAAQMFNLEHIADSALALDNALQRENSSHTDLKIQVNELLVALGGTSLT